MTKTDTARRVGMPPRIGARAEALTDPLPCGHDRACAPAYSTAQGMWLRGRCLVCDGGGRL